MWAALTSASLWDGEDSAGNQARFLRSWWVIFPMLTAIGKPMLLGMFPVATLLQLCRGLDVCLTLEEERVWS